MNIQHQHNLHHIQLIAAPNLSLLRHRRCRCRSICLFASKKKPAHDEAYAIWQAIAELIQGTHMKAQLIHYSNEGAHMNVPIITGTRGLYA